MKYSIFGKSVNIEYEDDTIRDSLINWLKDYPLSEKEIDVDIKFVKELPKYKGNYYNSPTNYSIYNNVICMNISGHNIIFQRCENLLYIYIKYNYSINVIKNQISKFRDIGYHDRLDNIGAFFHEMVLVLMQYILNDTMLIHSSAVKDINNGKVILFGGSGGVGKTSLELLFCNKLNYSFISDDISVVDKQGYIYPNLAYPKIYAYNTIDNKKIYNTIFKNRGILDKFQWNFMRKLKGNKRVRRAVSPKQLYKNVENKINKINTYYILQKTNKVNHISIHKLDKKIATYATYLIIKNEYSNATVHFGWSEYNTLFDKNIKSLIHLDTIYEKWKKNYGELFNSIDTYIVEIPIDIKHCEFLEFFEEYFKVK